MPHREHTCTYILSQETPAYFTVGHLPALLSSVQQGETCAYFLWAELGNDSKNKNNRTRTLGELIFLIFLLSLSESRTHLSLMDPGSVPFCDFFLSSPQFTEVILTPTLRHFLAYLDKIKLRGSLRFQVSARNRKEIRVFGPGGNLSSPKLLVSREPLEVALGS